MVLAAAARTGGAFFISRAGPDRDAALLIAGIIREAGGAVWLQDEDFGHASFMARMEEGFADGARLIALLSPAYQKSDYCRKKYNVILAADPLNLRERLIVFRIGECAPAGNLADVAYTDLVPALTLPDAAQGREMLRRLVRVAIGAERRPPEVAFWEGCRHAPRQILHFGIKPVPGFTGREAELAAIEQALWRQGGVAAVTDARAVSAAVKGLGGVGKTVLACEYAWRARERYAGVWWLRAGQRESLFEDLIALGARFLPGLAQVPERETAARAALEFLERGTFAKPWLLVYDNVEEPAALEGFTPRTGAHLLVTTRWADWQGQAAEVPVDVFSRQAAVDYLLAQARRPDAAAAARLAEALGDLPLALAHARALCWRMNWDFGAYREKLPEMIRRAPRGAAAPAAVFATFGLALGKAAEACAGAETLMGLFAFLAPQRIPLGLIPESVLGEIEKGEAAAALAEVSLVAHESLDDGAPAVSVHRLVQEVMRGRLKDKGGFEETAALATRLAAQAFPAGEPGPDDVRAWPICERLAPHADAVLAFAPETGEAASWTSLLCNQYGAYLNARASFAEAEPLMHRALEIDEKSLGPEHPNVAIDLNNLAGLLQATNRLAEAEPLYHRALAIDEKSFGPEHPNVATDLNNLALLLKDTNRLAEAEPLMRRTLAIDEKSFGPEHPHTRTVEENYAALIAALAQAQEIPPSPPASPPRKPGIFSRLFLSRLSGRRGPPPP